MEFVEQHQPAITVFQSDLLKNDQMKKLIKSGFPVIVLASDEIRKMQITNHNRPQLFLTLLQHAACYNIPQSVFKFISNDRLLFNAIS
jgi:hypothetical protein